jgi:glycosyltransferase involved in cell wall biosynthesis
VVTVVYNGETDLEETILSVLTQTYENIEYIIVDGASTDRTLDIIKKYEGRIDCWISEKDNGIYDAMNKGVALASGERINFMNAGDRFWEESGTEHVIAPNKAEIQPVLPSSHYTLRSHRRGRLVTIQKQVKRLIKRIHSRQSRSSTARECHRDE